MTNHLRHSGCGPEHQQAALTAILKQDPLVWQALQRARDLDLPDWMIVSGAIYNTVWNALTGKRSGHGVKDIDLFYHDATDLSWETEDAVIRRAGAHFAGLSRPVEVRNQARVHLWYAERFGGQCPAYGASAESLEFFASKTHAVGVRLEADETLAVVAPFGLDFIFSFQVAPNHRLDNARTHTEKGTRAIVNWPEITLLPWSEGVILSSGNL